MSTLRICLLGSPTVEVDGKRIEVKPRKALALLVYLACTNQIQRRDTLATLLWPEFGQSEARAALRRRLSELGQVLGGIWLETDRETVGLITSPKRWAFDEAWKQEFNDDGWGFWDELRQPNYALCDTPAAGAPCNDPVYQGAGFFTP